MIWQSPSPPHDWSYVDGSIVTHACSSPLEDDVAPDDEDEVDDVEDDDVPPEDVDDDEVVPVESGPPVHATAIAPVTNVAHPKMRPIARC